MAGRLPRPRSSARTPQTSASVQIRGQARLRGSHWCHRQHPAAELCFGVLTPKTWLGSLKARNPETFENLCKPWQKHCAWAGASAFQGSEHPTYAERYEIIVQTEPEFIQLTFGKTLNFWVSDNSGRSQIVICESVNPNCILQPAKGACCITPFLAAAMEVHKVEDPYINLMLSKDRTSTQSLRPKRSTAVTE